MQVHILLDAETLTLAHLIPDYLGTAACTFSNWHQVTVIVPVLTRHTPCTQDERVFVF